MPAIETLAVRLASLATSSQGLPYRPLDANRREIRLLILKKRSHSSMGRVEANLVYTSLACPIAYETVSYCWGDPSLRASILVNGRLVDVPASAETMLSTVSNDNKERTVWIDAVCINQNDKDERGHQVSIMGSIYRQCTRNLIYLGKDDGTVYQALCNITDIHRELQRDTHNFRDLQYTLFAGSASKENLCFSITPLETSLHLDSVLGLYSRTWFS